MRNDSEEIDAHEIPSGARMSAARDDRSAGVSKKNYETGRRDQERRRTFEAMGPNDVEKPGYASESHREGSSSRPRRTFPALHGMRTDADSSSPLFATPTLVTSYPDR
ncbi:hypothetical protein PMIN04_009364 [Paraphaeosphaeria minitans]